MATFQEHVKLITEANQTLAAIAKVNAAIMKLREQASKPINVKINYEQQKIIQGEQKIRAERQKTADAESNNLKKRLADYKVIKRMNEEQGGPAHNIRFGSAKSLEQGYQFNNQLSETTKRINQLADAHKHINAVAKAAGVTVTPGLAQTLANQTVNKIDKAETAAIKEQIRLQKELNENRMKSIALSMKLKEANARIESSAGAKAQIELQKEIERVARASGKSQVQVEKEIRAAGLETVRVLVAAQKEKIAVEREARKVARESGRAQVQIEREANRIASANERGARGLGGEFLRDTRRYAVYGSINQIERGISAGYESGVDRSTVQENLRQAGRTPAEIEEISKKAVDLTSTFKNLTVTELMTMQQHNRGATGNKENAEALNTITASYISLRKDKVGETAALAENLANLKIGEETGHINDTKWMRRLYDTQARVAQTEGAQYDPRSFLQTVRMEKTAKFNLSDEAQFNIMPFLNISEGAGRAGNEVAMLFKSLTYAGQSISKQNAKQIAGTIFSDGKGGYDPELSQRLAAGDITGMLDIVDKFLKQKGLDPTDKSTKNKTNEMNALAKSIGNTSAREALITLVENIDQYHKQQRAVLLAGGIDSAYGLSGRTLKSAQDAMTAAFKNMTASAMGGKITDFIINRMNNIADAENWAARNPGYAGLGLLAGGAAAVGTYVISNPGQAANTGALGANTLALYRNTESRAIGGVGGKGGKGAGLIGTGIKLGLGIGGIVLAGQAAEAYLGEDANSWTGIANRLKKDIRVWAGWDKDPNAMTPKEVLGIQSYPNKSTWGIYGPQKPLPEPEFVPSRPVGIREVNDIPQQSPFGTIGTPLFGNVNLRNGLGSIGAEVQRVTSEKMTNDIIDARLERRRQTLETALKSIGDSVVDGASKVGDTISSGGGSIVSALEGIAERIRNVPMPTFVGGGFHDLSTPNINTGHIGRGPQ